MNEPLKFAVTARLKFGTHWLLQRSVSTLLPSSQLSNASTTPLPQTNVGAAASTSQANADVVAQLTSLHPPVVAAARTQSSLLPPPLFGSPAMKPLNR